MSKAWPLREPGLLCNRTAHTTLLVVVGAGGRGEGPLRSPTRRPQALGKGGFIDARKLPGACKGAQRGTATAGFTPRTKGVTLHVCRQRRPRVAKAHRALAVRRGGHAGAALQNVLLPSPPEESMHIWRRTVAAECSSVARRAPMPPTARLYLLGRLRARAEGGSPHRCLLCLHQPAQRQRRALPGRESEHQCSWGVLSPGPSLVAVAGCDREERGCHPPDRYPSHPQHLNCLGCSRGICSTAGRRPPQLRREPQDSSPAGRLGSVERRRSAEL